MRQMILDRIQEIIKEHTSDDGRYISGGLQTIIKSSYKMNAGQRKAAISQGYYPSDFDFNSLDDEKLRYAFEHIVRCHYKSWA